MSLRVLGFLLALAMPLISGCGKPEPIFPDEYQSALLFATRIPPSETFIDLDWRDRYAQKFVGDLHETLHDDASGVIALGDESEWLNLKWNAEHATPTCRWPVRVVMRGEVSFYELRVIRLDKFEGVVTADYSGETWTTNMAGLIRVQTSTSNQSIRLDDRPERLAAELRAALDAHADRGDDASTSVFEAGPTQTWLQWLWHEDTGELRCHDWRVEHRGRTYQMWLADLDGLRNLQVICRVCA